MTYRRACLLAALSLTALGVGVALLLAAGSDL